MTRTKQQFVIRQRFLGAAARGGSVHKDVAFASYANSTTDQFYQRIAGILG